MILLFWNWNQIIKQKYKNKLLVIELDFIKISTIRQRVDQTNLLIQETEEIQRRLFVLIMRRVDAILIKEPRKPKVEIDVWDIG